MVRNHHWAAVVSRGWLGVSLSMAPPCKPVLCCPLLSSFQHLSRSSLHRLAGLPCRIFLSYMWSPSGDTRGPSVVLEAVDMPCPGPFHCSHIADYIYDFCPHPDPDVGLSIIVCDVEHTFPFWSVRPQVCAVLVWSVSRSLHHMS